MKAHAPVYRENGRETHVIINDSIKPAKQISELFQSVTAKLTPILRYGFSQLTLYDSSTGQLATRGSYFPNGKGLIHEGLQFPIASTPAGRVFTTGKPMRMNRTQRLSRSDLIERLLAEGVRSGCCVPLRSGGTIIGTFSIGSSRTHAFNSDTEQVLMAVSTDLGPLLEGTVAPNAQPSAQIPFSSATNQLLMSGLVGRVRAGDIAIFHELIRPCEKIIHSIAFSILHDHAEAEEVSQETVLKALTHLHQLHSPTKFRQWLLQIALNEARIRRRHNRHYLHEPLEILEESSSFSSAPPGRDPVEHQEFQTALNSALHSLAPAYREIVILRDIQQRTVNETATALGISVATVKTRLHRARRALRNNLSAEFLQAA
jgi:RNA polymerase sigma-70 factor (ECF subfamily)